VKGIPVQLRAIAALAAAVSMIGAAAGCNSAAGPSPSPAKASSVKTPGERKAAPEFSLKDESGKTVKLSDYKGKVVLLNYWATWCGPCKIEMPWFVEFERKHKDKGFAVVGVSMDEEGWEVVKPFLAESPVNYRMLLGNDGIALLYGGIDSLPTTFLIDREGRIAQTYVGLHGKDNFENGIQELLRN
jgi:peroxiredoxin